MKQNQGKQAKKAVKQNQGKPPTVLKRPSAEPAPAPAVPEFPASTPRRLNSKQPCDDGKLLFVGSLWFQRTKLAFAQCWLADPHHVPGLDESQRRLALALAARALEPHAPVPEQEARALAMLQRERWIWQIQARPSPEGRWKVYCQMTSAFNKEAGSLRAEVVRILASCSVPKVNINKMKNSQWLLCLDLSAD